MFREYRVGQELSIQHSNLKTETGEVPWTALHMFEECIYVAHIRPFRVRAENRSCASVTVI